jgi:D-alanyl-D-alanine carboxypeptidase
MKRYTYLSLCALLSALILTASCPLSYGQGFSPQTEARLQQVLQQFQNNPANPYVGGVAAAIKVDGLAFWEGATGYAARNVDAQNNLLPGGTTFTTGTISQIYSVTKTFTAALVLELAKEGMLELDDPVSNYLPLHLVNPGLNASVTIRQLLAHESGYSNYTSEMQFLLAVAFQPTHDWTPFEVVSFVHQVSQPGAERRYSSTNYILLGAIVEAATGKAIAQHFRERFYTPLGLSSMYLGVREPQPAGTLLASPHDNISAFNPIFQFTGQPTFPDAYTNVYRFPFTGIISAAFTGGGIVSNVADMAEWGNALFTGKATSQSTLDLMLHSLSSIPDAQGDYLGYGIWRSTKMSSTEVFLGHDGSAPGYRSVLFYQPDKKLTLAVMTNYYGADIYALARALYAALPEFTCGNANRKEEKIRVCFNSNPVCIDRNAAPGFIKKGAYMGGCENFSIQSPRPANTIEERLENQSGIFAFPNPASDRIRVSMEIKQTGKHDLQVFDVNGKYITTLFSRVTEKGGSQNIEWNTSNMRTGSYFLVWQTPGGTKRQKIIIVR